MATEIESDIKIYDFSNRNENKDVKEVDNYPSQVNNITCSLFKVRRYCYQNS